MKLTILNPNLMTPDEITVKIGNKKTFFQKKSVDNEIVKFIKNEFGKNKNPFIKGKAEIYYNINWDNDNIYYGYVDE